MAVVEDSMFGKFHLMGLSVVAVIAISGFSTSAMASGKVFMEEQTARWGSTYSIVSANHPNTCQNKCAKDKQCKSWTYVLPTTKQGGECRLKNMVPHRAENACCVSGVLVGQGAPRGDMVRGAWGSAQPANASVSVNPVVSLTPAAATVPAPVEPVTPVDLEAPVEETEEPESEPAPEPPVQLVPASYKP